MESNRKLSVWFIVAVPLVAGISTLELEIGGLNYTGFLWALMLPVAIGLLALNRMSGVPVREIFPVTPWLLWCGFLCASLFWTEELTLRNVQDALQLCMPVVVGMLAASSIRSQEELRSLLKSFVVTLVLLAMFTVVFISNVFDREWMSTNVRGAAMAAALVGCVSLAGFPKQKLLPLVGWGLCLLITTLTSSRMATLALLTVPLFHPFLRGRLLAKAIALGVFAGLAVIIFNTQTFQQHFFYSGQGSFSDLLAGDYADLGRFDAWSAVWEKAWQRPWFGTGVGSSYIFVPKVWTNMYHVHNDYLRVFFELGLVGLALYLAIIVWQLFNLRRQIAESDGIVRTTFSAAWLGLLAMLISCLTDNTMIYTTLYTNPLFALLGAAYGAAWFERQQATSASAIEPAESRRVSSRLISRRARRGAPGLRRANRPQPFSN